MPIYDQSYRRWQARGALRRVRFWPISREALRLILSRRVFLALLAVSWIPFVVRVIQVYIVTRFPEAARLVPTGAALFGQFLNGQLGFAMLLSIFGGAGLVANDLRTGAILVYLSRPLTRRDYVVGKLGVLLALNLSVTLIPGLMLYFSALSLLPDRFLKLDMAWIAPAIAAQSLLIALALSLLTLAISALSRSARVAGVALFGLWLALEIARVVASNVFSRPEVALLSVQANVRAVGNALFGIVEHDLSLYWAWPLVALVATALLCLAVLRSRVRAVEIVR